MYKRQAKVTIFAPGKHFTGGLLGYDYDRVFANGQTPTSLVILAKSPVINDQDQLDSAYTTYYRADSGAMVFDAGSIWWSWGLDEMNVPGATQINVVQGNQGISDLTGNVIKAMYAILHHNTGQPYVLPISSPCGG